MVNIDEDLQRCRDNCAKLADEIRVVTNNLRSQRAKEALTGGAYFLEQCINDGDQAVNLTKR